MKNYDKFLPEFYLNISDIVEIGKASDLKISAAEADMNLVLAEMSVMTCSEDKLAEWETLLSISKGNRTTMQRRPMIMATMQGASKLNEEKIKNIVKTFSGGDCIVTFTNSAINVKVKPPSWGEFFLFPDIELALRPLIPAHLGLTVERFYNTWNNRKNTYASWNAVKSGFTNWNDFKNKIE